MKNKLFRSIFTATMTVFLLCFVIFVLVLYFRLDRMHKNDLYNEADYLATAIENEGIDFLAKNDPTTQDLTAVVIYNAHGEQRLSVGDGVTLSVEQIERVLDAKGKKSIELQSGLFTNHCAIYLSNGDFVCLTGQDTALLTLLIEILLPLLLILVAAILLSVILASKVANDITAPIVRIDPDSPDGRGVYEELLPFVDKLRIQNQQVRDHIEQIKYEHEKQDEMRREFTANVSHELKTPLTAISGTAEIMEQGMVKAEDIPHFAGNIRKEAHRLITLVNDILELSRLDENALPTEKEPIDLLLLCKDITTSLALNAEKQKVNMTVSGDDAVITGHVGVIGEMIYNLCDNAIKYNREGGYVNISITRMDSLVRLQVADNGIGIPEKDVGRIFERFYRVDKSHSKQIGGTGLGLSIVKHGAKLHGATVTLDTKFGQGTTVTLDFPLDLT